MDPAEVLAIELPQYAGSGLRTLVPKVFGLTAESSARKRPTYNRKVRTAEEIWARAQATLTSESLATAHRIYDWMVSRSTKPETMVNGFNMSLADPERNQSLFQLNANGQIFVWFRHLKDKPPFSDRQLRLQLAQRLSALPGITIPPDKVEAMPKIPLSALQRQEDLDAFLATMDWALALIRAA